MLEVKGVSFVAKDGRRNKKILDNVSIKIPDGSFTVITGPNGSGKSTLANLIMGIIQPTKGSILFNEEDITNKTITERAKLGVAFSFQQPVKFKGLTVYDLLSIARGELVSPDEAGGFLNSVGLNPEEYLERDVNGQLSGGELKRIEIATVLARGGELLIFDEPEAGIDLWSFDDLIKILKKLKSEQKTLIIISHQEKILKLADNIVVMNTGKITKYGTVANVLPSLLEAK